MSPVEAAPTGGRSAQDGQPRPILLAAYQLHMGGNERDLGKLARHLDPSRFQVHVASFDPHGDRAAELAAAGVPVLDLPVNSFKNRSVLRGAGILRDYVRRHKIQLIHAFDPATEIFSMPLARLLGIRAVSSHCFFRFLIPQPYRSGLRLVDRCAHRIVVNAQAIRRHLMSDFGIAGERIFVSYNGVEPEAFFPPEGPRPRFFGPRTLVIGTLCVMRPEKRIEVLIEAFARLFAHRPEARLLLVGDGEMKETWRSRAEALGVAQACHFEPATTDAAAWMRQIDVYVLPSESEGFPNSLLEAMACGCAVVASDVGGIPELVEDGASGRLFPPGDAGALAERLRALADDSAFRERLGQAAAERARARFSMPAAARRMADFYDSLL